MANGATHILVGGLTGLGVALGDQEQSGDLKHDPILAVVASSFFAKMPDILEPASNPHHRQFCHSVIVFAGLCYGAKKAYDWKPKDKTESLLKTVLLCAGAGYISHLLLDGMTPRSLPLVGSL